MEVYALELATGEVPESFLVADGSPKVKRTIPIGAFLLDHPKGKVLVDSGLPDPKRGRGVARLMARWVDREVTAADALKEHGLDPREIRHVLLTHMHWDHTGGIPDFPDAKIWVSREDLAAAAAAGAWRRGHAGVLLPPREATRELDFGPGPSEIPFDRVKDLFGDGSILVLPVGGHTPGSVAVLVSMGSTRLLLCGDACFTAAGLMRGVDNGYMLGRRVDRDRARAALSRSRLRRVLAMGPSTRVLPSHDPDLWAGIQRWPNPIGEVPEVSTLQARGRHTA